MNTPASIVLAAAMMTLMAAPVVAGGGQKPIIHNPQVIPAQAYHHGNPGRHGGHRSAGNTHPSPVPAAGMPSFYQPSYSIDRKDWWRPHPYFQSNGQGFDYPTHPVTRTHPGYRGYGR